MKSSMTDVITSLNIFEKNFNEPSICKKLLETLSDKTLNAEDDDDDDDDDDETYIATTYESVNPNKQPSITDYEENYLKHCDILINILQSIFNNSDDIKIIKDLYKEYKKIKNVPTIKRSSYDYNGQLTEINMNYDTILNENYFNKIISELTPQNQQIDDDTLNQTIISCLNQKNNRKILLHNDNGSKSEFITRFLNYIKTQNDDSIMASQNTAETPAREIYSSKEETEMPAGDIYIENGLDANFMMQERFSSRIKKNLNNLNNTNFDQFKINIQENLTGNESDNLHEQLKIAYDTSNASVKLKYKQTKFYIDAGDIIHDVNKRPTDEQSGSYFNGLILLGNAKLGLGAVDIRNNLNQCFANTIQSNYVNVNQEKTRKMRNDASLFLQNEIATTGQNNNLLLPKIESRLLEQREGYFELIKHIYTISDVVTQFVYSESGRELNIKDIVQYYNNLSSDDKEYFFSDCINYCDYVDDNDKKTTIKALLESTTQPASIQVELLPITSFDGCGASSKITNNPIVKPSIFNNVFGYYNYTVYTVYNDSSSKYNHLVIVTIDGDISQSVQAIFGFYGNITINMLLQAVDIDPSRPGKGEKGGLIPIQLVYNVLINKDSNFIREYQNIDFNNITLPSYYERSIDNEGLKNLLLLGNKTIGDLIFTTYDHVYSVSTVDSLIADSTMYNFLSGNSEILQSVWMQTGGKGWKFTPGLFKVDINTKATFISIQLLSSLMFLKSFDTFFNDYNKNLKNNTKNNTKLETVLEADEDEMTQNDDDNGYKMTQDNDITNTNTNTNDNTLLSVEIDKYNDIIKSITDGIDCSNIQPLGRFYSIINYILVDFNNIKNYISSDNIYNACMVQLLIYENYIMKKHIFEYIEKIITCIREKTTADHVAFLNNIYKLPKLDTLFLSNITNLASNNAESYPSTKLFKLFKPTFHSSIHTVPSQIPIIDIKIENQYINISYYIKSTPPPQDVFEKEGYSESEIKYTEPKTYIGDRNNQLWNLAFQLPYTIETLINLYSYFLNNKSKYFVLNDTMKEIKNRIVSFFNDAINSVKIDNRDITDALYNNLNEILKKVKILDASDNLQNIDAVDFNDDEEDCGKCVNGICSIETNTTTSNDNSNDTTMNTTEGGTRKNKRKQPKKYKSYNRKNKTKSNRKSKSKKHTKSKNKRKPIKSQRYQLKN
jgi:hypothetical protein